MAEEEIVLVTGYKSRIPVQFFLADISDTSTLQDVIFHNVNVIFHCATFVSYAMPSDSERLRRVNVEGTRNLLVKCLQFNIGRFIYNGSTEACVTAYRRLYFSMIINPTETKCPALGKGVISDQSFLTTKKTNSQKEPQKTFPVEFQKFSQKASQKESQKIYQKGFPKTSQKQYQNTSQTEYQNTSQTEYQNTSQTEYQKIYQKEFPKTSQKQYQNTSQTESFKTSPNQSEITSQTEYQKTSQKQYQTTSQTESFKTSPNQSEITSQTESKKYPESDDSIWDQFNQSAQKPLDHTQMEDNCLKGPCLLFGDYARSLAQAEQLVLKANGTPMSKGGVSLKTIALRHTPLYGETDTTGFIANVMKLFHRCNRVIRVCGLGNKYQLTYAGNAAWANITASAALNLPSANQIAGYPLFITDDTPIMDTLHFVCKLMNQPNPNRWDTKLKHEFNRSESQGEVNTNSEKSEGSRNELMNEEELDSTRWDTKFKHELNRSEKELSQGEVNKTSEKIETSRSGVMNNEEPAPSQWHTKKYELNRSENQREANGCSEKFETSRSGVMNNEEPTPSQWDTKKYELNRSENRREANGCSEKIETSRSGVMNNEEPAPSQWDTKKYELNRREANGCSEKIETSRSGVMNLEEPAPIQWVTKKYELNRKEANGCSEKIETSRSGVINNEEPAPSQLDTKKYELNRSENRKEANGCSEKIETSRRNKTLQNNLINLEKHSQTHLLQRNQTLTTSKKISFQDKTEKEQILDVRKTSSDQSPTNIEIEKQTKIMSLHLPTILIYYLCVILEFLFQQTFSKIFQVRLKLSPSVLTNMLNSIVTFDDLRSKLYLNYKPKYSFQQSLDQSCDYYKKYGKIVKRRWKWRDLFVFDHARLGKEILYVKTWVSMYEKIFK
ncbi:hypothetical protein WDU94_005792 [Cyamophila willieti]